MISKIFLVSLVVLAVRAQQNANLPCGFSCSRNTQFFASLDGGTGSVTCSDGASVGRCNGCCQARGLQSGLPTTNSVGFSSSDGRACVCCFSNTNRNCGSSGGVFPTFGQQIAADQQFQG